MFLGYPNLPADKPRRPLGQEASEAIFTHCCLVLRGWGLRIWVCMSSLAMLNLNALRTPHDAKVPTPLSHEMQLRALR